MGSDANRIDARDAQVVWNLVLSKGTPDASVSCDVPGAVRILGVITICAQGREQTLTQAADRVPNKLRHQGL
jgi:hypothetical protein